MGNGELRSSVERSDWGRSSWVIVSLLVVTCLCGGFVLGPEWYYFFQDGAFFWGWGWGWG